MFLYYCQFRKIVNLYADRVKAKLQDIFVCFPKQLSYRRSRKHGNFVWSIGAAVQTFPRFLGNALTLLDVRYVASFKRDVPGEKYDFRSFGFVIDLFFVADICLNFCTAYYHKGRLVTNNRRIVENYLRTFFIIDLVASVRPLHTLGTKQGSIISIYFALGSISYTLFPQVL